MSLTSIIFLLYFLHDLWLIPEAHERAWAIRFGVFLPVALWLFPLMWSRAYARLFSFAMLAFGFSVNAIVFWIAAVSGTHAGYFIYSSYAVMFVVLGPFIARMSVITQVIYTLGTVALYATFDWFYGHASSETFAFIAASLLSLGGIGAIVAWIQERDARQSFLQRRTIKRQMSALDREKQMSDALLLNVLPPKIAERLKREHRAIADRFPEVTVLFADLVGFTKMSERLSPQDLVRRLNDVFSSFDDLADELGLEKIKTIGDAYMVVGGLSLESDHVEKIAQMALRVRETIERMAGTGEDRLSIRVGIHTGLVVGGVIGKRKFAYDVWGDTVNTASRMESHAEPGTIQVSERTFEKLKDGFLLEERGEIEVKGKGKMRTFYLLGRREAPPKA